MSQVPNKEWCHGTRRNVGRFRTLFRVYRYLDESTRVLKVMRKFIHKHDGQVQLEEATAHLHSLYAQLSSSWTSFRMSNLEGLAEVTPYS